MAVAAGFLVACAPSAPPPLISQSQSLASDQTLHVHLESPPRSLDPALAIDGQELGVVRLFAEPLLKPSRDGQNVVPAAASSYDVSDDGLTWTFHLRANGRYSDGQPVRAADFAGAWRRLIDPRTSAPNASFFATAVRGGETANALDASDQQRVQAALDGLGLQAPDDYTFVVTSPLPLGSVRWIATLPEGAPWRADMAVRPGTIANGPFFVEDGSPGHVVLAPNPNYWGGRPTLSRVAFAFGSDPAPADVLAPAPEGTDAHAKGLVAASELTSFWVAFNTERAPLDNGKVRLAIATALARDEIATTVFKGRAAPTTVLIPPGMRAHRPDDGHLQDANLATARQLLDQSGVARDQLVALPLIVANLPVDVAFANQVATQVGRDLGVTMAVQPLSAADYAKRLRAGDFALAAPRGWTADYADPSGFFDLFRSNDGNNVSRWRNARYDQLVRLADTTVDSDRRDAVYAQADQLLVSEAPAAFAVDRFSWSLVKPWVRGAASTPGEEWPGATNAGAIYIASH